MSENIIETKDLSGLLADYEGKWVILSEDESHVLAFGDTVAEIANELGRGFLFKVPSPLEAAFIPTVL